MNTYLDLLAHMEWADALIWTSVLGSDAARDDADIRTRMHHFHVTQWAYLQAWRGEPLNVPDLSTFESLRAVAAWGRRYHLELPAYTAHVPDAALHEPFDFPWTAEIEKHFGTVRPVTLAESMLQIVLHTTHHRGQVALRLRERGVVPPTVDYLVWVWMGRPAPSWAALEAVEL